MSMTHDQIIAVVQAHKAGKAVEFKMRYNQSNGWQEAKHLIGTNNFDFATVDYRVKPEPREWWVNVSANGRARLMVAFETEQAAEESAAGDSSFETIHVREVLE